MNLDYVFHHVEQSIALMRGKRQALDKMDITSDGFWQSFTAIAVSLPALFFVWVVTGKQDQIDQPGTSLAFLIARDAAAELFLWILPILAYLLLLQFIGYGNRFATLIIARNWAMVGLNYLTALIFIPQMFMPNASTASGFALLFLLILILTGLTNLTKHALGCGFGLAASLVIGEFVIVTFVSLAIYGT